MLMRTPVEFVQPEREATRLVRRFDRIIGRGEVSSALKRACRRSDERDRINQVAEQAVNSDDDL